MLDKQFSAAAIARAMIIATAACALVHPAAAASSDASVRLALSELKKEELPKPAEPTQPGAQKEPSATDKPAGQDGEAQEPAAEQGAPVSDSSIAMPNAKEGAAAPEVEYDVSKLPFPVQKMRELILTAAKSGNIEALRPLIGSGDDVTMLSLAEIEGDPLAYLKSLAGDPDGMEILAILVDVLESGYVHLDAGTPDELYVWPYFFAYPLDKLDAKQKVELFQIVTAGDYDEMKQFGTYVFYRLGITPKGRWRFFVTGD